MSGALPRLGLVDSDEDVRAACADALDGVARVVPASVVNGMGGAVVDVNTFDALVIPMSTVVKQGVGLVARCMQARRGLPVLILAKSLVGELVDDLMSFGVANFLNQPIEPELFRRKVQRSLEDLKPSQASNKRNCFRATVPNNIIIVVTLSAGEQTVQSTMVDLSIATDGQPGGMLVRCDREAALSLPLDALRSGEPLDIEVEVGPREKVRGLARMVGDVRPSTRGSACIAMQYEPNDPRDASRMRDLWVSLQRRRL